MSLAKGDTATLRASGQARSFWNKHLVCTVERVCRDGLVGVRIPGITTVHYVEAEWLLDDGGKLAGRRNG